MDGDGKTTNVLDGSEESLEETFAIYVDWTCSSNRGRRMLEKDRQGLPQAMSELFGHEIYHGTNRLTGSSYLLLSRRYALVYLMSAFTLGESLDEI